MRQAGQEGVRARGRSQAVVEDGVGALGAAAEDYLVAFEQFRRGLVVYGFTGEENGDVNGGRVGCPTGGASTFVGDAMVRIRAMFAVFSEPDELAVFWQDHAIDHSPHFQR